MVRHQSGTDMEAGRKLTARVNLACLDWRRSAIRQIESGTALSGNAAAAETVIVYRRRDRARWFKCGQREHPSRYSVSEIVVIFRT
jgi:hypothetical protein